MRLAGPAAASAVREPADLCGLLGVPYSDEQLAAITAGPDPLVVVAGAGSGKTTVIAARVVWLVATGAARPDEVLGLTFTNKAAAELAHRVRTALRRAGLVPDPAVVAAHDEDPGEPSISTYHAYAADLIREHGLRLGIEPGARLLTDAARYQLAARVIRSAPGPIRSLTKSIKLLAPDLLALEAECSEHLVDLAELRSFDRQLIERLEREPQSAGASSALGRALVAARRRSEFTDLVEAYRAAKKAGDLVDFGDQMALAACLAEQCPPVGVAERARHRVVVLDEYQDTSVAQRRMLVGLFGAGHPVTAVGDPCQAIYGWRGASVANLEEFPEHFVDPAAGAGELPERLTLRQNRRNAAPVLALANELAAPLRALHAGVEPLLPALPNSTAEIRTALLPTWADELSWLGDQVADALDNGTPPAEIAVLVRATRDIGPLHTELIRRQIPVEVVGLGGLVHLPEIADIIATLEVLDSPTADAALIRLLIGPRWRIGPRDHALLGRRAKQLVADPADPADSAHPAARRSTIRIPDPVERPALADAMAAPGELPYSEQARVRYAALDAELRSLRAHLGDPLLELLHLILARTGLDVELAVGAAGSRVRRRHSVEAFLNVAADFADLDGGCSVGAFLAYLQAAAEHERGLDSAEPVAGAAVQLMTAHKAKGLEWNVVVLPSLCAGVFPSTRGRSRWTTGGHCLPFPLRGDRDSLPEVLAWSTKGLGVFDTAVREQAAAEELRLAYVAVTRPRHRLVMSGHWWGPTQQRPRGPSEYLATARAFTTAAGRDPGGPWEPDPTPGATNPAFAEAGGQVWPAPLDAEAFRVRRDAAEMVRAALAGAGPDERSGPVLAGLTDLERGRVAAWDHDLDLLLAAAQARRPRGREVTLPTTLTVSQFGVLTTRPDALARDLARPMPRPPAPAALRGSRFHSWLVSRFGQQVLVDDDELPGGADAAWCSDAELAMLQEAFERSEFADRVPIRVEAPFALPLAGRVVRGRIDAVYATATGYEIVDWKTGLRTEADPTQLALYRLAWAQIAGVAPAAVTAAFHFVRSGRTTRPELPDAASLAAVLSGGPVPAAT
jgi:DNA helicase-2/ATP-dependent DNA helicase PcrA